MGLSWDPHMSNRLRGTSLWSLPVEGAVNMKGPTSVFNATASELHGGPPTVRGFPVHVTR